MEAQLNDLPFVGRWGPQRVVVELTIRPDVERDERKIPFRVYLLEGGGCVARGVGWPTFFPNWEALIFQTDARIEDYDLEEVDEETRSAWDVSQLISRPIEGTPSQWEQHFLEEGEEWDSGHETW